MKTRKEIVNAKELARHLRLSPRRIRQLAKIGMPKIARDKFDFIECAGFYIRFLQRALENKGAEVENLDAFRSQKSRALTASAELKELKLARERAELVTHAEASEVLIKFSRIVRARLSTAPVRLAGERGG
jgi:phage terminase Nu1 subunit (DNA packaging protein)